MAVRYDGIEFDTVHELIEFLHAVGSYDVVEVEDPDHTEDADSTQDIDEFLDELEDCPETEEIDLHAAEDAEVTISGLTEEDKTFIREYFLRNNIGGVLKTRAVNEIMATLGIPFESIRDYVEVIGGQTKVPSKMDLKPQGKSHKGQLLSDRERDYLREYYMTHVTNKGKKSLSKTKTKHLTKKFGITNAQLHSQVAVLKNKGVLPHTR